LLDLLFPERDSGIQIPGFMIPGISQS